MIRMIVIPLLLLFVANIAFADRPPPPLTPSESLSGRPLLFEEIEVLDSHPTETNFSTFEDIPTHTMTLNDNAKVILINQAELLVSSTPLSQSINFIHFSDNHPLLDVDLVLPELGDFSAIKISGVSKNRVNGETTSYLIEILLGKFDHEASIFIFGDSLTFSHKNEAFKYSTSISSNKATFFKKRREDISHQVIM